MVTLVVLCPDRLGKELLDLCHAGQGSTLHDEIFRLARAGCNIHARDAGGNSAIMLVLQRQDVEVSVMLKAVALLQSEGAEVLCVNDDGKSALSIAEANLHAIDSTSR